MNDSVTYALIYYAAASQVFSIIPMYIIYFLDVAAIIAVITHKQQCQNVNLIKKNQELILHIPLAFQLPFPVLSPKWICYKVSDWLITNLFDPVISFPWQQRNTQGIPSGLAFINCTFS